MNEHSPSTNSLLTRRQLLRAGAGATALAFLTSCHSKRQAKAHRIAVPLQGMTAEFMQLWVRGARAHPAVKNGMVELTIFDGRMDALTQANQFDTIITQRFDAVIFIPADVAAGIGPAAQAKAAGIPVIGSNTLLSDRSLYVCYIGSEATVSGEDVARDVITRLGGKGNVVILEGLIGQSAQIQRRQGINNILAKNPNIKVLETKAANWSRADAQALMENWLTAHGSAINGVISQNDEMALGAIEAMKARGINLATHPVGGIDGLTDALEAVKRGEMSTILQDANAQAQGSIDLALRRLIGPSYQPTSAIWNQYPGKLSWGDGTQTEYLVPWTAVTSENVDQLLAIRRAL
jgi:putative xylitol transport system substrate-binding protein